MMSSYRVILTSQPISHDDLTYLSHLIRFCVTSFRLKIEDLQNACLCKDVVIASNPLPKTQVTKQATQFCKSDIRVSLSTAYANQQFAVSRHNVL